MVVYTTLYKRNITCFNNAKRTRIQILSYQCMIAHLKIYRIDRVNRDENIYFTRPLRITLNVLEMTHGILSKMKPICIHYSYLCWQGTINNNAIMKYSGDSQNFFKKLKENEK